MTTDVEAHAAEPAGAAVIDLDDYRQVFRRHPAGVCVVTVDAGSGPVGFTATSLSSLSLEPPLVSFAIDATASSWPAVRDATTLVLNLLGVEQEDDARRFATSGIDRFASPTRWARLPTGEPVLQRAPVQLRCQVFERLSIGDHHIVVALALEAIRSGDAHDPLLYVDGTFRGLPAVDAPRPSTRP